MKEIGKYTMALKTPASWQGDLWKEALPTGNGKIGASIYGAIKQETILVNHSNLWHWGKRSEVPDVSGSLTKTREYIQNGKYDLANEISSKELLEKGYEEKLFTPCPVGAIRINMHQEDSFSKYLRTLDMESGEVQVKWTTRDHTFIRRTFVSRTRDVIILSISADKPAISMDFFLQLHETYHDDTKRMKQETKCGYFKENECLIYQVEDNEDNQFGMAAKVLSCDGNTTLRGNKIEIQSASNILIAVKVFGSMDKTQTFQKAVKELAVLPKDYKALLKEHTCEHYKLFHSVQLELGEQNQHCYSNEEWLLNTYENGISNELCERLWHYGRYLFISGTAEGELPFNMYGLWGGRYELLWSHNMANINIQMMYWHCIGGGYASYIKVLIDYYFGLMEDFRENAKMIFGLDGIYLPAGTTPGYGLINQVVPVIVNWIGGAGWIAQHMYEYYEFTRDKKLLLTKILPFMKEAALFYEQYLIKEGDTYQVIPSVSPENTPANYNRGKLYHMSHANPTAKNATMDIAIIKELLSNLVCVSKEEEMYSHKLPIWEDIINGLPDYMVNEDGAIKEWADEELEDFYYHRHISHLYPLFPGKEIDKSDDMRLRKAFEKAVDLRILGGQSGWSMAQMACVYARLKKGNKSLECIENISKSCLTNSFFTLHNDWRNMGLTLDLYESRNKDKAPVQLDASLGIVSAIQEMLLYNIQNKVMLIPALPDKWSKGKIKDFHFIGGRITAKWDIDAIYLEFMIESRKDQCIVVYLPEIFIGKTINDDSGKNEAVYKGEYNISIKEGQKKSFIVQ